MKVLLVDSKSDHRKLYAKALVANGFELAVAGNAQTALDALDEFQPDVVVTEISLPNHNGITILKEMMTYDDWAKISVIVLSSLPKTAFDVEEDVWKKLNVIKYCYKPEYLPTEFAKTLAKIKS